MALVVSEPDQKDFELPEDGQYLAVIVDVIDLGEVQTGFGIKPKVQIKWMLDAFNSEGFPFYASSFYTASLHEKANLRKALKSILGADVSGQFDLEELLGINNQLVIQQNTPAGGEKTYANIVAILKAAKGKRLAIPDDFQRKSEKDAQNKQAGKKQAAPKQQPALKKSAAQTPVVEPETAEPVEQEPAIAPALVQTAKAPANRAATIRQARTVTPAPAAAPATDAKAANLAALRAQLAAAEAESAPTTPISDDDIPF